MKPRKPLRRIVVAGEAHVGPTERAGEGEAATSDGVEDRVSLEESVVIHVVLVP
jgi:hypothetical protein